MHDSQPSAASKQLRPASSPPPVAGSQAAGEAQQDEQVSLVAGEQQPAVAAKLAGAEKRPLRHSRLSAESKRLKSLASSDSGGPPAPHKGPLPAANQNHTQNLQNPQQQQQQQLNKTSAANTNTCAACAKPIRERYLLVALDKQWHEDCLKCACCDCRLGEVGRSLFHQADKIFCRRDFLRIFGRPGHCAACKRSIPPYELVMRANDNVYHMDCFACQHCQYRFCVGDQFHLTDRHLIVCLHCHSDCQQPQQPAAAGAQQAAVASAAAQPTSASGGQQADAASQAPASKQQAPGEQPAACAV